MVRVTRVRLRAIRRQRRPVQRKHPLQVVNVLVRVQRPVMGSIPVVMRDPMGPVNVQGVVHTARHVM